MRDRVIADGLGWLDAETGREFIMKLGQVLFDISPFHDKLAHARQRVPEPFRFSKDANDWKSKAKKEPRMTQELLEQQQSKLASILSDVWIQRQRWRKWRDDVEALESALDKAEGGPQQRGHMSRQGALGRDMSAAPAAIWYT